MRTRRIILLLAAVMFALPVGVARSDIVTIRIDGEVSYVDKYSTVLNDLFVVGEPVSGEYVYDTDTPDSSGSSRSGLYWHYDGPYGISLSINEFVFQSAPDNLQFLVGISDRDFNDGYLIRSYTNLALSNGLQVNHISWQLDDYSGTPLSSTVLPATAPVLEDWDFDRGLTVELGEKGSLVLGIEVTDVMLVPEPTTCLLLGLGTVAFVKRRRMLIDHRV